MKIIWQFNKLRTEAKGECDKNTVIYINKMEGKNLFKWRIVEKSFGVAESLEKAIKQVEKILK